MRTETPMSYGYVLGTLLVFGLTGCGTDDKPAASAPAPTAAVPEVSADNLRRALGMETFFIEIPQDGLYGLTLKHAGGFAPAGFSSFKAGDRLRAFYWLDGDRMKYSLQSDRRGGSGEISVGNPVPFRIRNSPSATTIYKPGDIVALWTVNDQLTSGSPEVQPGEGEAGVVFMRQDAAKPVATLNLQAAAPKPEAPPAF